MTICQSAGSFKKLSAETNIKAKMNGSSATTDKTPSEKASILLDEFAARLRMYRMIDFGNQSSVDLLVL